MGRLGSFRALAGVVVGTVFVFLLLGFFSCITWQYGTGCAKLIDEPPFMYEYTDDELDSLRESVHTASWSWFYIPTRRPGFYQGYQFFKHLTVGWPMTYLEKVSGAEGCFDPWIIHTEWYLGGFLFDGGVSAGFGILLYWLSRFGFRLLRARGK